MLPLRASAPPFSGARCRPGDAGLPLSPRSAARSFSPFAGGAPAAGLGDSFRGGRAQAPVASQRPGPQSRSCPGHAQSRPGHARVMPGSRPVTPNHFTGAWAGRQEGLRPEVQPAAVAGRWRQAEGWGARHRPSSLCGPSSTFTNPPMMIPEGRWVPGPESNKEGK